MLNRDLASIQPAIQRLNWLLFAGQSLSSAAFMAGGTVAAIVGAQLTGQAAWAGVPGAVYMLGVALGAYPAARLMERTGRRLGLSLGFLIGVGAALAAGLGIVLGRFGVFLVAYTGMGAARGFIDLGRYAAAEMVPEGERARAMSRVVLGGTVGARAGPALVAPLGAVASRMGVHPLAGPFLGSLGMFAVGLLMTAALLRPDPHDLARRFAPATSPATGGALAGRPEVALVARRPLRAMLAQPATRVAIAAMVLAQMVMTMLMSITAVHMTHLGHSLGAVSLVIMAHVVGMFGLSVVTGRLADRWGRGRVIAAGAGLLVLACLLAPLSQQTEGLALALFLLGLGWNFCYVAGGALLTDSLRLDERGPMQGSTDLAGGLISALGSLQSGAVFAAVGFAWLSGLSLAVALVPLVLALRLNGALAARPSAPAAEGGVNV